MYNWIVAESSRARPDGILAREMSSDRDLEAGARAAAGLRPQLEGATLEGHGVVPRDEPLLLVTQDLLEVDRSLSGWATRIQHGVTRSISQLPT